MWWRSVTGLMIVAHLTIACGFKPIAAPTASTNQDALLRLRDIAVSVRIDSDAERFEYLMRQELRRFVSTDPSAAERLVLFADIDREGLAIEQNDAVTRFNLTATLDYSLLEETGVELLGGTTVSITALNATASQFSTNVSEREALRRIAGDLTNRIVTILRLHYADAARAQR